MRSISVYEYEAKRWLADHDIDRSIVHAEVVCVDCSRDLCDDFHALVGVDSEGNIVEVFGEDGGEPEDQTLERDWDWVGALVNNLLALREKK